MSICSPVGKKMLIEDLQHVSQVAKQAQTQE